MNIGLQRQCDSIDELFAVRRRALTPQEIVRANAVFDGDEQQLLSISLIYRYEQGENEGIYA